MISTETGANDALNQHYITALRKYEVIKDDYDSLRKRYDDLIVSHSAAVNKLELSQVSSFNTAIECIQFNSVFVNKYLI